MVVRTFGEPRQEEKLYNHVDLVQLLDIVDLEAGTAVAGEPGGGRLWVDGWGSGWWMDGGWRVL